MRQITAILLIVSFSSGLFAQKQDTLKHKIVKEWHLSHDFTEEVSIPFDTVFSLFHQYRLADKYSPFNATLGNYGLPFYQINFFDRITDPDKFLYTWYYPLMYQPERYIFMNTQVPFTELVWTYGGPREIAEQTFRVRHSQNVNRFLNFGLIFDIVYNLGQYGYQRAIDKDFTFYSSYTLKKYNLYFALGINNLSSNENGGIKNPAQLQTLSPADVEVRLGGLDKALSAIKNRNFLLVQHFTVGKKTITQKDTAKTSKSPFRLQGTFSHVFILDANRKTYSDNYPGSGFYDTTFISDIITFDSLSARSIKNTVRFDFSTDETRKFRLGGGVGIRNELLRYSQIIPNHDTLLKNDSTVAVWHRSNNVLIGKLFNNVGELFGWVATGELYFSGYRAGDFNLNGIITKSFNFKKGLATWNITGGLSSTKPSFWMDQWGSNNFEWHNNLNKVFRMDIGTNFSYPARKTELRFNYAIIDNYTDFDTLALPSQHTGGLSVASLFLSKDLRAWKFHLTTDLLVQKSSNSEVLDLPLVAVKSAAYFEHMFNFRKTNGQLNTQLGAEVLYHTLYHPYLYMPATGRFYRQDVTETGNYPFINVFLNLKLRRTRIFLMLDHVNQGYTGYNYFMVPSYPMNVRMFRYGIAWTFYD
ncbi:MAG: putative porin [Bacteroidota bacterium]|nr:putative porin [Bacteroidota bacterium]